MADPLLSINEYVCTGTQTEFEISFAGGYLSRDHVVVLIGSSVDANNNLVDPEELSFTWVNDFSISISPAPAADKILRIYRNTPFDAPVVDFTDQSVLSETTLDANARQAVFLAAELRDRFGSAVDPALVGAYAVRAENAVEAAEAAAEQAANIEAYSPVAWAKDLLKDGSTDLSSFINQAIAEKGMIEFPSEDGAALYGVGTGILVQQSNVHLRFQRGAKLFPVGTLSNQMIDIRGAAPTSWVSLASDAYARSCVVETATDPGWQVGDWLELRSDKVIDSTPNYLSDKVGDCIRIARKERPGGAGNWFFMLDTPLNDNFLVADNAVAGKATVLENIVIEDAQFNTETSGTTMNMAIRAEYCAGLKIIRPRAFRSKVPFGNDRVLGDYIKLINCIGVHIEDPCMTHGGYYGLSVLGFTRQLRSFGGTMTDVRHAVSTVQLSQNAIGSPSRVQGYGQPFDILVQGMTALNTTLSSFDTHDTGLNVRYVDCVSVGAGDDGFQFRSPGVRAVNCVAYGAYHDGFSGTAMDNEVGSPYTGAEDCELINCRALLNGRLGANFRYSRVIIRGGEYSFNGSTRCRPLAFTGLNTSSGAPIIPPANQGTVKDGAGGILVNGGIIDGPRIEGNAGTGGVNGTAIAYGDALTVPYGTSLMVSGVDAPGGATQTKFLRLATSLADFGLVTLGGRNQINGYATLFDNGGAQDNIAPVTLGGNFLGTSGPLRKGRVTLNGGEAFVPNTNVRNSAATAAVEAVLSEIQLKRVTADGVPGALYVREILDGVGFTISSTARGEPTRTNVIRNNTNVGAVPGVLGITGVLPTNWSINALSGLTAEIVSTGTETGPGGGTQNYIDIKLSGTATATNSVTIAFDTSTNPAAAATVGDTWTASFGAKLQAGAMTGISPSIILHSRDGSGNLVDNLSTSISINSTGRRFTRTGTFAGATAAFARALVVLTVANGTTVDGTIRFYMPQLEEAATASAPIATSGTAATRTLDTSTTDQSVVEWTAYL